VYKVSALVILIILLDRGFELKQNIEETNKNIEETNKNIEETNKNIINLQRKVAEVDSYLKIPKISDIQREKIFGQWIKVKNYKLKGINAPLKTECEPLPGWDIENCNFDTKDIENCLPFALPEKYINVFKQNYCPFTFYMNIHALIEVSKDRDAKNKAHILINYLVDKTLAYTKQVNDSKFIVYNFDNKFHEITVKAGWVSCFANSVVMQAFLQLYVDLGEDRYLKLAHEYFNAFKIINSKEGKIDTWFSYADASDYLWFEELPIDGNRKAHILNGHIEALIGLYKYYKVTKKEVALKLLQAGLLTIHRYGSSFRYPGSTNRYDLYAYYNKDYGPARTVAQQLYLHEITDEAYFKQLSEFFLVDNPLK